MALSASDRITKANIFLMGHPPTLHFSGLLMVGDTRISDEVPTAATNGRDCTYNPEFVESLTDPELRGLILHESLHKAYQHLFLWQSLYKEDAQRANRACDFVINLEITDLDSRGTHIALPPNPCLDERYRGMDSKQVFDLLKEEGGNGKPLDEHQWEDAQGLPEEERQAIAKEIDAAIRQGALLAGKQGGNVPRSFADLQKPKVDWREQLRDYISSICAGKGDSTWAKPNRRWLHEGLYMPSQISESIGGIVVGIDTSGSIDQSALTSAVSELVGICEAVTPERVDLLYWDADVAAHETYFEGDYGHIAQSTKPKGGGGTEVACVVKYIKEHILKPVVCILITDMYTSFPGETPPYPVLWVDTEAGNITPPFGSIIRVKL